MGSECVGFFNIFIYLIDFAWQCWVLVAGCGLSPVVSSEGRPPVGVKESKGLFKTSGKIATYTWKHDYEQS